MRWPAAAAASRIDDEPAQTGASVAEIRAGAARFFGLLRREHTNRVRHRMREEASADPFA